jgi:hypothetical protein
MEFSCWVSGHLTGGLGNRLFQHAAAAGLAEQWRYPLVFHVPECEPTNHGPFDSIFKLFPSIPVITENKPVQRIPEMPGAVFTYTPFPPTPVAQFASIDGWRQTERYFPTSGLTPDFSSALPESCQRKLLETFKLETNEQRKNTWFLHIRLGDYKILPHHQIDLNGYYSKAVAHITKGARVLLFSDDLNEYGPFLIQYLEALGLCAEMAQVPDELETLYLMSNCWGGAIVANSTFSWWGAYFTRKLHPEPESYVAVFPSRWGNGLPPAIDIVPAWGTRVQN